MSTTLHPGINELEEGSLSYSLYKQLYLNFFNSQDKDSIKEGDSISIKLHNSAYLFAEVISSAVDGSGGNSGVLQDYLKITGGDMRGKLRANYGFEAGTENQTILYITDNGVNIKGVLELESNGLLIGGKNILSYSPTDKTTYLESSIINFGDSIIQSNGSVLFGKSQSDGIYISKDNIKIKNNNVFHSGNCNNEFTDWIMNNSSVNGKLEVNGKSTFKELSALHGVELGYNKTPVLSIYSENISVNGFLSFASGKGIKMDNQVIMERKNKDVYLCNSNGDVILGNETTQRIKLNSGLTDYLNRYLLISKYGAAYFPDSLTVRHGYGDEILESYRVDKNDEGIIVNKNLRFGTKTGALLFGENYGFSFQSFVEHIIPETNEKIINTYKLNLAYNKSESIYQPQNRISDSLYLKTDADFFNFNKPLEVKTSLGIIDSTTQLKDGFLLLGEGKYLQSSSDGIKHYGNAFFLEDISSERFASGFAGYGWSIMKNKVSNNYSGTFDELTVRKKMRIYEMEVQKINAVNGALWVSDNCEGDTVYKI